MEHLVGRIQATNYLYFIEDELDPKGKCHNKPLFILIKYKDYVIAKKLIILCILEYIVKAYPR